MKIDLYSLNCLLIKLMSRSFEGIEEVSISLEEHDDTKELWPIVDLIFDYEHYMKQFRETGHSFFSDFDEHISVKVRDYLNFVGFSKKKIVVEIYVTNT